MADPSPSPPRLFAVRSAGADDIEPIVELHAAVAAEGRWLGTEPGFDREERAERLRRQLDEPATHALFVAVPTGSRGGGGSPVWRGADGSPVIGSLGMEHAGYGVAEFGMAVAAEWRGRGVGSALLGAAIDWARAAGAHKVVLQVWPHNGPGIGLYRKYGFVEEGRLRRHYRRRNGELWDAVAMGLVLDERSPGSPYPDVDVDVDRT